MIYIKIVIAVTSHQGESKNGQVKMLSKNGQ